MKSLRQEQVQTLMTATIKALIDQGGPLRRVLIYKIVQTETELVVMDKDGEYSDLGRAFNQALNASDLKKRNEEGTKRVFFSL